MREIDATQLVVKKVLVKLEQKKKKGGVFVVD